MQDQVIELTALGITAQQLTAETARSESSRILSDVAKAKSSGLRFLYVTPERVSKSKMLLSSLQVCLSLFLPLPFENLIFLRHD